MTKGTSDGSFFMLCRAMREVMSRCEVVRPLGELYLKRVLPMPLSCGAWLR